MAFTSNTASPKHVACQPSRRRAASPERRGRLPRLGLHGHEPPRRAREPLLLEGVAHHVVLDAVGDGPRREGRAQVPDVSSAIKMEGRRLGPEHVP
jgi:hypothetical protein